MRKWLAIILTLAFVLALVPAAAMAEDEGIPTEVNILGSSGTLTPPIIKAKWEQNHPTDMYPCLENGDPTHVKYVGAVSPNITDFANSQFLPPLVKGGTANVSYYAIVTDPAGIGDVVKVFVDVYYPGHGPSGMPETIDEFNNYTLDGHVGRVYQCFMTRITDKAAAIAAYTAARDARLVTFQTDYDDAEIMWELNKWTDVGVYKVDCTLDYEDPAGLYEVCVNAYDSVGTYASEGNTDLCNFMRYVAVPCIEVDFDAFDYGDLNLNIEKWVNGDIVWDEPIAPAPSPNLATVRNIGNVEVYITIEEDDRGISHFGLTPTEYSGTTAPTDVQSSWDVYFDARIGNTGTSWFFDPNVCVTLEPGCDLDLSDQDEIDLSIHVSKALVKGSHTGEMWLGSVQAPWNTPDPVI